MSEVRQLVEKARLAFGSMCVVGCIGGLAGGADLISDLFFGGIVFLLPAAFTVWMVARIPPQRFDEMTGHDRWRAHQESLSKDVQALKD